MYLKDKKLLILGANAETIPIVQKAMDKGIYTLVTDHIMGSPAKKIANQYFDINGKNVDKIIEMIRKEKIDAVLVGVADPLLVPYIKICHKMGFPCFEEEATAAFFQNKEVFRQICKSARLPVIREFFCVKSIEEIPFSTLKFPIVIKPAVSRVGKGIFLCSSLDELKRIFEKAKENSANGEVIGEEYMSGMDVIATFIFVNGTTYLLAVSDRTMCKGKTGVKTVTCNIKYPSRWTKLFVDKNLEKFCSLFDIIGVKNGIANIQMFVRDDEFIPYDPECIINVENASDIFHRIYNIDIVDKLIEFAFSGRLDIEEGMKDRQAKTYLEQVGASVAIPLRIGRIGTIVGKDEVEKLNYIIRSIWKFSEGDLVTEDMYGTEKATIATIWIKAESECELMQRMDDVRKRIKVKDIFGNDMVEVYKD